VDLEIRGYPSNLNVVYPCIFIARITILNAQSVVNSIVFYKTSASNIHDNYSKLVRSLNFQVKNLSDPDFLVRDVEAELLLFFQRHNFDRIRTGDIKGKRFRHKCCLRRIQLHLNFDAIHASILRVCSIHMESVLHKQEDILCV